MCPASTKQNNQVPLFWHIDQKSILTNKMFFLIPRNKRKGKRTDSVLWQKPLHSQKIQKASWQHKNAKKNFNYTTIANRLDINWIPLQPFAVRHVRVMLLLRYFQAGNLERRHLLPQAMKSKNLKQVEYKRSDVRYMYLSHQQQSTTVEAGPT